MRQWSQLWNTRVCISDTISTPANKNWKLNFKAKSDFKNLHKKIISMLLMDRQCDHNNNKQRWLGFELLPRVTRVNTKCTCSCESPHVTRVVSNKACVYNVSSAVAVVQRFLRSAVNSRVWHVYGPHIHSTYMWIE